MRTIERTLRRLHLDLCNEFLVTFATRVFNSQYKGCLHGFFDNCLGDSDVSRSKRSIPNVRFALHPVARKQADLKNYSG